MKNLTILNLKIGFFVLTSLKEVKKSMCSFISFFVIIINLKIVRKEPLDLKKPVKNSNFLYS